MEITRSDGYYRPFPQDKRDCKKCANLIEIGCYKSDKEYIRYKVENENGWISTRIGLRE